MPRLAKAKKISFRPWIKKIFSRDNTRLSSLTAIKTSFPEADMIGGIGDDAFITPPGQHILKENYYITMAVGQADDPKNGDSCRLPGIKPLSSCAGKKCH
jgi:hypothetical protein